MEFSILEMLIILAILLLNFVIISYFSNKTAVVSSVMITNLMIILLYSTIISDHKSLQELIIATILYSVTTLIITSNTSNTYQMNSKNLQFNNLNKINYVLLFILIIALSVGSFYLINNIKNQPNTIEQIVNNNQIDQHLELENSKTQPKRKNEGNVLFKRSADAILIMVGAMTILFLSSKYRNYKSNI